MSIGLIEAIVAVQCYMNIVVAHLTQRSLGAGIAGWKATARGSLSPSLKGSGCTRGEATARVVTMRTTHASRWVVRRVASGGNVSTSNREIKRSLMLF
jgi:hypothetical protein